ncbi:MAG: hypothetical protein AAF658_03920 [Myxococcota bacterium]
MDLRDRFETSDGSRPEGSGLADALATRLPLAALRLLDGGDVFERVGAKPPAEGPGLVERWLAEQVRLERRPPDAFPRDAHRLLAASPALVQRLLAAKPLRVFFLEPKQNPKGRGLPRSLRTRAAGLFWDHPSWDEARGYYRLEHLDTEPVLIAHELAHAVHYLALTSAERDLTYRVLRPSFGSRSAMDEAFAIYSEREFLAEHFRQRDLDGPGIYGAVRRQWSEDHVFTRFIRKLYYPHKPLAGPKLQGWM